MLLTKTVYWISQDPTAHYRSFKRKETGRGDGEMLPETGWISTKDDQGGTALIYHSAEPWA